MLVTEKRVDAFIIITRIETVNAVRFAELKDQLATLLRENGSDVEFLSTRDFVSVCLDSSDARLQRLSPKAREEYGRIRMEFFRFSDYKLDYDPPQYVVV